MGNSTKSGNSTVAGNSTLCSSTTFVVTVYINQTTVDVPQVTTVELAALANSSAFLNYVKNIQLCLYSDSTQVDVSSTTTTTTSSSLSSSSSAIATTSSTSETFLSFAVKISHDPLCVLFAIITGVIVVLL
jgi:hypothetical protein